MITINAQTIKSFEHFVYLYSCFYFFKRPDLTELLIDVKVNKAIKENGNKLMNYKGKSAAPKFLIQHICFPDCEQILATNLYD